MAADTPSEPAFTDASSGSAGEEPLKIVQDATCTFCGCLCDDIDLSVKGSKITHAERACELGQSWFLSHGIDDRPCCLIEGEPADIADGIERAARILTDAKYPIIDGLAEATCAAQQAAVAIGDWIGACVDSAASVAHGPAEIALQTIGKVTCTLGEVMNRGDFIMFWGSNPAETHPRHFTKYSLMPQGMFVPNGRKDRTCVVVDVRKTHSAQEADLFVQIKPGRDWEALGALRALCQGIDLDPEVVEESTGVSLSVWQDLMERMQAARFGVIFFGAGLAMTRGKHANCQALLALTRDMNQHTRFACLSNHGRGNVAGAENVISWQTGYPFGVNLARGYPRFNPGEYTTAETLGREEADAAMIVAADPMANLPQAAQEHLAKIPYIVLDPQDTRTMRGATVAFTTATYGINTPGTVYRMDGVPLPLRPAFASPHPSAEEILKGIERQVRTLIRER
ncbi:MAG: formylmethanofuran dehydrogenase subunit B [Pirellulales bacterium]|nr:formylmethanofuran dehydrogenase subunit B [Pirellulales bacterium]